MPDDQPGECSVETSAASAAAALLDAAAAQHRALVSDCSAVQKIVPSIEKLAQSFTFSHLNGYDLLEELETRPQQVRWIGEAKQRPLALLRGPSGTFAVTKHMLIIGRESTHSNTDLIVQENNYISRCHMILTYTGQPNRWNVRVNGKNGVLINDSMYRRAEEPQSIPFCCIFRFPSTSLKVMFRGMESAVSIEDCSLLKHGANLPPCDPPPSIVTGECDARYSAERSVTATPSDSITPQQISPSCSTDANFSSSSTPALTTTPHPDDNIEDYKSKEEKPPYSYAQLIVQAIISTTDHQITLSGIYAFITNRYPWYRATDKGWQNSIRHNLSLNRYFLKVARAHDEPGKGSFWRMEPSSAQKNIEMAYKKRKLKTAKGSKYTSPAAGDFDSEDGTSQSQFPSAKLHTTELQEEPTTCQGKTGTEMMEEVCFKSIDSSSAHAEDCCELTVCTKSPLRAFSPLRGASTHPSRGNTTPSSLVSSTHCALEIVDESSQHCYAENGSSTKAEFAGEHSADYENLCDEAMRFVQSAPCSPRSVFSRGDHHHLSLSPGTTFRVRQSVKDGRSRLQLCHSPPEYRAFSVNHIPKTVNSRSTWQRSHPYQARGTKSLSTTPVRELLQGAIHLEELKRDLIMLSSQQGVPPPPGSALSGTNTNCTLEEGEIAGPVRQKQPSIYQNTSLQHSYPQKVRYMMEKRFKNKQEEEGAAAGSQQDAAGSQPKPGTPSPVGSSSMPKTPRPPKRHQSQSPASTDMIRLSTNETQQMVRKYGVDESVKNIPLVRRYSDQPLANDPALAQTQKSKSPVPKRRNLATLSAGGQPQMNQDVGKMNNMDDNNNKSRFVAGVNSPNIVQPASAAKDERFVATPPALVRHANDAAQNPHQHSIAIAQQVLMSTKPMISVPSTTSHMPAPITTAPQPVAANHSYERPMPTAEQLQQAHDDLMRPFYEQQQRKQMYNNRNVQQQQQQTPSTMGMMAGSMGGGYEANPPMAFEANPPRASFMPPPSQNMNQMSSMQELLDNNNALSSLTQLAQGGAGPRYNELIQNLMVLQNQRSQQQQQQPVEVSSPMGFNSNSNGGGMAQQQGFNINNGGGGMSQQQMATAAAAYGTSPIPSQGGVATTTAFERAMSLMSAQSSPTTTPMTNNVNMNVNNHTQATPAMATEAPRAISPLDQALVDLYSSAMASQHSQARQMMQQNELVVAVHRYAEMHLAATGIPLTPVQLSQLLSTAMPQQATNSTLMTLANLVNPLTPQSPASQLLVANQFTLELAAKMAANDDMLRNTLMGCAPQMVQQQQQMTHMSESMAALDKLPRSQ